MNAEPLDAGSAHFDPSNLEFTSVDVGNKTVNVIPGEARARFNIRFNDRHTPGVAAATDRGPRGESCRRPHPLRASNGSHRTPTSSSPSRGRSLDLVTDAIAEVTGRKPELSTSGGTSDARFIKDYCPVVEFGLVGATMHQVDERVPTADLVTLAAVYRKILQRYFR